jgi:hypothetical protein
MRYGMIRHDATFRMATRWSVALSFRLSACAWLRKRQST